MIIIFRIKSVARVVPLLLFYLLISACKKDGTASEDCPGEPRKVQFMLYTTKDFTGMNANVLFTLSIKNNGRVVWDSLLPPIKLSEIPGFNDKIIVEKVIPNDMHVALRAGFVYAIENVGFSWFIDDVEPCIRQKNIDFDFQ